LLSRCLLLQLGLLHFLYLLLSLLQPSASLCLPGGFKVLQRIIGFNTWKLLLLLLLLHMVLLRAVTLQLLRLPGLLLYMCVWRWLQLNVFRCLDQILHQQQDAAGLIASTSKPSKRLTLINQAQHHSDI
jgi:hypothetical protein